VAEPESRRERLIAAALDVLDQDGPNAVTTRRLAERAGTTTMSVYSEFGSLGGVVQAVVEAGFEELSTAIAAIERTPDPVADVITLGAVYRQRALARPHLYRVMFGLDTLGGYRRSGDELRWGIDTFGQSAELIERAIGEGRLATGDPWIVSLQLWASLHGHVLLEMSGLLGHTGDPVATGLQPMVEALLVGLGDERERVHASMRQAVARITE
jgi:AcrR family transcriptional regulator